MILQHFLQHDLIDIWRQVELSHGSHNYDHKKTFCGSYFRSEEKIYCRQCAARNQNAADLELRAQKYIDTDDNKLFFLPKTRYKNKAASRNYKTAKIPKALSAVPVSSSAAAFSSSLTLDVRVRDAPGVTRAWEKKKG